MISQDTREISLVLLTKGSQGQWRAKKEAINLRERVMRERPNEAYKQGAVEE